jgi:hypothetical protein
VLLRCLAYSIAPQSVTVNDGILHLCGMVSFSFLLRSEITYANTLSLLVIVCDPHVAFTPEGITDVHIKYFHCRAAAIYYVLCTYISPPTTSFSEAVYPPNTIEEEQERIGLLGRASTPESDLNSPSEEKASDFV